MILQGETHTAGEASGPALRLEEPLSFWGGVDPATGTIIDRKHPQYDEQVAGRVLIVPHGRGSSSGSGVLAECMRAGTGPAAIIMGALDPILLVGVLVAAELYPDRLCPIVVIDDGFERLVTGVDTRVHADGRVEQP